MIWVQRIFAVLLVLTLAVVFFYTVGGVDWGAGPKEPLSTSAAIAAITVGAGGGRVRAAVVPVQRVRLAALPAQRDTDAVDLLDGARERRPHRHRPRPHGRDPVLARRRGRPGRGRAGVRPGLAVRDLRDRRDRRRGREQRRHVLRVGPRPAVGRRAAAPLPGDDARHDGRDAARDLHRLHLGELHDGRQRLPVAAGRLDRAVRRRLARGRRAAPLAVRPGRHPRRRGGAARALLGLERHQRRRLRRARGGRRRLPAHA